MYIKMKDDYMSREKNAEHTLMCANNALEGVQEKTSLRGWMGIK